MSSNSTRVNRSTVTPKPRVTGGEHGISQPTSNAQVAPEGGRVTDITGFIQPATPGQTKGLEEVKKLESELADVRAQVVELKKERQSQAEKLKDYENYLAILRQDKLSIDEKLRVAHITLRDLEEENESLYNELRKSQQTGEKLQEEVARLRQTGQPPPPFIPTNKYLNCIQPDKFSAEVNNLAALRIQMAVVTDDAQRKELLRQALAISRQILEAIFVDLVKGNIQKIYADAGPSLVSWSQLLFGDDSLFNKFLKYEEDLFRSLALEEHTVDELIRVLTRTRERSRAPIEPLQIEKFKQDFEDIYKTVRLLQEHELIQANQRVASRKIVQTLSIVVTVANAAGPFIYPFLSTEVYASSVTIGGLGLTLAS